MKGLTSVAAINYDTNAFDAIGIKKKSICLLVIRHGGSAPGREQCILKFPEELYLYLPAEIQSANTSIVKLSTLEFST